MEARLASQLLAAGFTVTTADAAQDLAAISTDATYPYIDGGMVVNRMARIERSADRTEVYYEDVDGGELCAILGDFTAAPSLKAPAGFRRYRSDKVPFGVAAFCYVLLYAFGKQSYGTEMPFEFDGKRYVGKLEIHDDGPNGPRPGPHPGVDLYETV